MTTDVVASPPTAPLTPETWPGLTLNERRVLGVLVEKAKTTPDAYPLTLHGLITGSNQKSNRDPVLALTDADVEEALETLKKLGYAQQIMGSGRADKFRHALYDALRVDKVQLAILGELLLRGGQTEGELRTRASRMEPIDDLDALRSQLRILSQRGLVVYLTPEGRRGTIITHGLYPAEELEQLKERSHLGAATETAAAVAPRDARPASDYELRLQNLESAMTELRALVKSLEIAIAGLHQDCERPAVEPQG